MDEKSFIMQRIVCRSVGQCLESICADIVSPGQFLAPSDIKMSSITGNIGLFVEPNKEDLVGTPIWIATEANLPALCEDDETYPVGSVISINVCMSGDIVNARTIVGNINAGSKVAIDTDNPGYIKTFDTSSNVMIGSAIDNDVDGFVRIIIT